MRQRKASATNGKLDRRLPMSQELMVLVVIALVGAWTVWSFGQELMIAHHLSAKASEMRVQNAALQSENAGYRKDIAAMASGAGAEEEARMNGYARGDERLYLISAPAPSPPSATPRVAVRVESGRPTPFDALGRFFSRR